jgi:hypothetical protein
VGVNLLRRRVWLLFIVGGLLQEARPSHATILGRQDTACPVYAQKFRAVVAVSVDTSAGVDRDLFARSAGPQAVFYEIATCPRCCYSGYLSDFEPGVRLPPDFRDKLLKSPKLNPGMSITPQTDQREIPARLRYELAVQCYRWRGMRSEAMAWLYLRASWIARDEGSVMPRTDRLQRVMGFIERWLPRDTSQGNQADRELQMMAHVAAELAEGRFSRLQAPYVRFVLAVLCRQHGENDLFEALLPPGAPVPGLPDSLQAKVAEVHASIARERQWQRLALEAFLKALDAGEILPANRPAAQYLVGELYRRLGQPSRAILHYDRALGDPLLDAHLADWARQQRAVAEQVARGAKPTHPGP